MTWPRLPFVTSTHYASGSSNTCIPILISDSEFRNANSLSAYQATYLTFHPTDNLHHLSNHCAEFLIHAADNEGLQRGIDERLITTLASYNLPIPITYAGGGRSLEDLDQYELLNSYTK